MIQTVVSMAGKSNLADPVRRGAASTKKKVNWADTQSKPLENVQHFFLDEAEKGILEGELFNFFNSNLIIN